MRSPTWKVIVAVLATSALALTAAPATADGAKGRDQRPAKASVQVVAEGLNGPRQVSGNGKTLYVAESDIGQVTRIRTRSGSTAPAVTGLAAGVTQGVTKIGKTFVVALGEPGPGAPPPETDLQLSSLYTVREGGEPRLLADLLQYELDNNPDGQVQFVDGVPVDALSNPFHVIADKRKKGYVLVADGGANAVLAVDKRGRVSTFFVPPTVNTGACEGLENNPGTLGCDAVPTGLAYGPGNRLYVSALTAEVPGEGRVYVLDARTGKLKDVIGGLSSPTGVAVDGKRNVYVSELFEGAPEGEPGPDFDPSTIGQIVKIDKRGNRSYAQVTMPTGLLWADGSLYASAWSIAGFLGIPDAGQVVRVKGSAFQR